MLLIIMSITAAAAGCGKHGEETPAETDALAGAETVEIETETTKEETSASAETKTTATETTEESSSGAAAAVITQEEARKLLIEEFGEVDEGSGDKNVFTYEEVVTVDGVDYYSYRWEAGDGTYLCNAFIRTDGTDALTGIYSDGKWELGSDFGSDDFDDSSDDDVEYDYDEAYDDEEYDDREDEDAVYDDGFGDVYEEGEEPAEDDEIEAYDTDDEAVVEP